MADVRRLQSLLSAWTLAGAAAFFVVSAFVVADRSAATSVAGETEHTAHVTRRLASAANPGTVTSLTVLRVGWCSKSITVAAAPFAIAISKGWLAKDGLTLDLTPAGGSRDCVQQVVSETLAFALPSVEQAAVQRLQGTKLRYFYTAYQNNIYGMAVPANSAAQSIGDLKGARVGVISATSASATIARLLARDGNLDPDRDVTVVISGDPLQTATLLKAGALDALSQFDTHYALVERAGVPLRRLPHPGFDQFPANGLLALEDTLKDQRREAVALARAYAKGTLYATANPVAAIRALWAVWPATRPENVDETTALEDAVAMLNARARAWQLDRSGAKSWGEHVEKHYQAYLDWLFTHTFINEKIAATDLTTNELVKDINDFDAAGVLVEAAADRP